MKTKNFNILFIFILIISLIVMSCENTSTEDSPLTSQEFFQGKHDLMPLTMVEQPDIYIIIGEKAQFAWKSNTGSFITTDLEPNQIRWCPLEYSPPYCKFRWSKLNYNCLNLRWKEYIIYVEIYCGKHQIMYIKNNTP